MCASAWVCVSVQSVVKKKKKKGKDLDKYVYMSVCTDRNVWVYIYHFSACSVYVWEAANKGLLI